MDGLIRGIGLMLRLPFVVVGFVLWTAYSIVVGVVLLIWYFVLGPLLWAALGLPWAFISVSFSGSGTTELAAKIERDVSNWKEAWQRHLGHLPDGFRGLGRWLRDGPAGL